MKIYALATGWNAFSSFRNADERTIHEVQHQGGVQTSTRQPFPHCYDQQKSTNIIDFQTIRTQLSTRYFDQTMKTCQNVIKSKWADYEGVITDWKTKLLGTLTVLGYDPQYDCPRPNIISAYCKSDETDKMHGVYPIKNEDAGMDKTTNNGDIAPIDKDDRVGDNRNSDPHLQARDKQKQYEDYLKLLGIISEILETLLKVFIMEKELVKESTSKKEIEKIKKEAKSKKKDKSQKVKKDKSDKKHKKVGKGKKKDKSKNKDKNKKKDKSGKEKKSKKKDKPKKDKSKKKSKKEEK